MRLKKANHNVNHELQMFFEELSRIKTDVVANCENLKAVTEWVEHMEIDDSLKQQMIKELTDSIQQFDSMCRVVFKEKEKRIQSVLDMVSKATQSNSKKNNFGEF